MNEKSNKNTEIPMSVAETFLALSLIAILTDLLGIGKRANGSASAKKARLEAIL